MGKYESVLKFRNYTVNEIYFKRNENFKSNEDKTPIDIEILPKANIEDNLLNIILMVKIFNNAEEKNYPFEMNIKITGEFETKGDEPRKFIKNAIAIMYPYIRAIVSTYTANANINALILPAINVNKLIDDQEEKKD